MPRTKEFVPKYPCVVVEEVLSIEQPVTSVNIEVLSGAAEHHVRDVSASSSATPFVGITGRFGSSRVSHRGISQRLKAGHNCLQESLDWNKIDCRDFLRLAKEVPVDDLFECIIRDKMYSKTERTWDLSEFVLQRKDKRLFIGGQGVVVFVRRQGHTTSLAMKICYHKREEKRVERQVQRTILHLKAQSVSPFIGKILGNYLTRRFFITIMPKAKFASLKSLMQELGPLSEAAVKYYFACITSALIKLHSIHICHRDVKCDNVLLMHNGIPALIDFGLAVKGPSTIDEYNLNSRITQMQYYPPETKSIGNLTNDYKIDSWLLGFFLCELLLYDREHLWSKFKISSQKDWSLVICSACRVPNNPAQMSLLSKLLLQDPKTRLFPNDLQHLPYLKDGDYFNDIETIEPPDVQGTPNESVESERDTMDSEEKEVGLPPSSTHCFQ